MVFLVATAIVGSLVPSPRAPTSPLRHAAVVAMCASPEPDLVRLGDISRELFETLNVGDSSEDTISQKITEVHAEAVEPRVLKIYTPSAPKEERRAAIEGLSRSLDELEEVVRGPMLAGSDLSAADAVLFPSIALCELTLPVHFGWTEWTDEALFWRRPRLHAWWELLQYESACKAAKRIIRSRLEEIDFSALAMDVPTSQLRTFPKHTM